MAQSKACLGLQPQYTYKQKQYEEENKKEKKRRRKKFNYPAFQSIRNYTSKKTKQKETKTT